MIEINKVKGRLAEYAVSYVLNKIFLTDVDRYSGDTDKGIDLWLKLESPINKELFDFNFQVKIGKSYVEDSGKYWRIIGIDEKRFKQWKSSTSPVVLVWIDEQGVNKPCYWTLITNSSSIKRLFISKKNILTPATPYELITNLARKNDNPLKKINVTKLFPKIDVTMRDFAKGYFRKHLLSKQFINPIIGDVQITWNCWHHLTRNSRKKKHILFSLELLPVLQEAIQLCNKVYSVRRIETIKRGQWTTEIRLIVFKVNPSYESQEKPIFLVVRENISFNNDWEKLFVVPIIRRQLVVESIYRKE